MTFVRKASGANIVPTIVKRRSGGTWVGVQNIYRRSAGAWVKVWSAYTPISGVTASPSSAHGSAIGTAPTAVVRSVPDVVITWAGDQSAAVTWSKVSGSTMSVASDPDTEHVYFSASVPLNATVSATYRATVNDGTSSSYVDVPVSLDYSSNA